MSSVLTSGLAVIPPESRLSEAVRFGMALAERGVGDEHALDELHARYGHLHWVHVLNNAALIAYALAASDGELGPAIAVAVSGGWDTDSAGATVGAICGALSGAASLPRVVDRSVGRTVPDDAARLRRRHRGGADGSDLCGGIVTATPVESTSAGGVVVVGSANADLVLRLAELPRPGETRLATDTSRLPGGKGANQAVAAARAGASTTLIAAIGDDADGRLVRDALVAGRRRRAVWCVRRPRQRVWPWCCSTTAGRTASSSRRARTRRSNGCVRTNAT